MEQIQNVGKPVTQQQPVGKQEAEGAPIYTSNGLRWVLPNITTSLIEQYADNALLAEPVNNLKNLIFRGAAQVTITDPMGETDNDLSEAGKKIYENCELYAAHQIAFTDGIFGGCSVFSPGWENGEPVEFRNLPWNSFRDTPQGFTDIYNDIMSGIVIDHITGLPRVFQKKDDRSQPVEIQNFVIIKDPTSPKPAGKPECLPVVALITNYNYADKVVNQKLNREGAPSIFPYVEKITAANKAYVEALAKKWGKDTCFILTEGMDFKDPKMILSNIAPERQAELRKRIDAYFNPATFIQKDGNTIGASDSGAMELIYNYIDKVLSTLEAQITKCTLQRWLDDNGYEGYRAEIKHPRPSVKKDAQVLAEVAELARNGAITINEMRQSLPNTDFGELTPEVETALQEQVRSRQPQSNPFGGGYGASQQPGGMSFGIGNVQSPVERTEALSQVERELIAATRQCATDVKRIVMEQVNTQNPQKPVEASLLQRVKNVFMPVNNASDEGKWVTINGTPVLIKDGDTISESFKRTTGKDLGSGNHDIYDRKERGDFKIEGKNAYFPDKDTSFRVSDPKTTRYAMYDKEGRRVYTSEDKWDSPEHKEILSSWDRHALTVSQTTKAAGVDPMNAENTYIRFGRPSPTGKSVNFQTGEQEQGVSAFKGKFNPESGMYDFEEGSGTGGSLIGLMHGGSKAGPKTPYLATGTEIGTGSDGEPVLKDVVLTHTLESTSSGFKRVPLKITPSKKFKRGKP